MARKAMATRETVEAAVEGLAAEGLDPTVERVRSKLGGGSYTTINKILGEVLSQRQTVAAQVSEVPSDLVEVGQRAVAAIYAAVQRQAAAKVELIETARPLTPRVWNEDAIASTSFGHGINVTPLAVARALGQEP